MISELYLKLKELKVSIRLVDGRLDIEAPRGVLNNELLSTIKLHKEELIQLITSNMKLKKSHQSIVKASLQSSYPMSSSQRRLWLLSQFEEGSVAYHMPGVYVFAGNLDRKALELSFNSLLERHEILRTVFREDEQGEVGQVVLEEIKFNISYQDLQQSEGRHEKIRTLVQQELVRPFDLASGLLIRAGLYQVEAHQWIFTYTMHHIISDGWSMNILIRELLLFYTSYSKGEINNLLPLPIHYKDYAVWQQQQLNSDAFLLHQKYWLKKFEGELPVLELVGDYVRPAVKTYNGGLIHQILAKDLALKLGALIQQQHATLFIGLLALVNTLLYRYTGQGDQIIGSPVAGREHVDLEDQIGFYVNTLALRSRFNGTDSFKAVLAQVRKVTTEAYEHQAYPFDELIDALMLQRDMSRNPLFDVMVILQNNEAKKIAEHRMDDLIVSNYADAMQTTSKFDLIFGFAESAEGIQFSIGYNSDIFTAETVSRFAAHLEQLMVAVLDFPDQPIEQLDYLGAEEKQQLLFDFNPSSIDYPKDKTITELFEAQAAQTPDHIAVVFEDIKITYHELNEQANQLADYLRKAYTISPDDLIGIRLERGVWVIISILGVLKSGGAYVPLDPEYPQERIDYLVKDSQCRLVIDAAELEKFTACGAAFETGNSGYQGSASHLAYVIYTSGSTGNPKGVAVEHRNVVRLVKSANYVRITAEDHILSLSNFSFDGSVFDIFGALLNGASLVIPLKDIFLDFQLLGRMIQEQEISLFFITTALFNSLADIDFIAFSKLQYILFGGERVSTGHVKKFRAAHPEVKLVHVYGPTENTTFSSYYPVVDGDEERFTIPIGSGISNSQCYILNGRVGFGQLSPVGIVGEICVGGDGLARGYLNRPELTLEKFVSNPFVEGERLYQTGDLGRWLADGSIEFIGRRDDQVKIRGFRIELGEVETALQSYDGIDAAVVLAVAAGDGERSLVAYVTGDGLLNAADVRTYLVQLLPGYMIPAYFMQLDEFPLTVNGKVDKKRLPAIEGAGMFSGVEYAGARNETESRLIVIWSSILGISAKKISVKDNFFEIGGHSLKATRLVSRIHKEFDVKINIKDLFSHPVLEAQACLMEGVAPAHFVTIPVLSLQADYGLSSSQRRLWILNKLDEESAAYHIPAMYVLEGQLNYEAFKLSFNGLMERHEILRTVFREDVQGEIRQVISPLEETGFEVVYQNLQPNEKTQDVNDRINQDLAVPFDLISGPLVRARLYNLAENRWIFTYTMHHIISDGWSMEILIKELLHFYNAYSTGDAHALPPLRIQYKDYAAWQQQELKSDVLSGHRSYWLKQFDGELPVLALTGDYTRPLIKTYHGEVVSINIEQELSHEFKRLAGQQGGTLFMGLLTALNVLLHRHSGQEDLIVGSPIAGRENIDLEDQIGFYVNTLALRSRFKGTDSFKDLLGHVKQVTLDAYAHQVFPFDELVDALQLQRDMSRSPLFDVMLVLQNNGGGNEKEQQFGELSVSAYEGGENLTSKFDLTFSFVELPQGLRLSVNYNSDIFSRDSAIGFAAHLKHLLGTIVASPDQAIGKLDYLFAAEKAILLDAFNTTTVAYPEDKTITALFEAQVNSTPEHTALVFGDISLSYRELNARANQFGSYLQGKYSIAAGDLVGIKLERSSWLVIAILGILKTGGAYVPIDPDYPQERIAYMLSDSGCKVLIDENEIAGFEFCADDYATDNLLSVHDSGDLVYVIYTSGSTGQPKGVMVEHRSLVNLCYWHNRDFGVSFSDRASIYAGVAFDASAWEVFPYLLIGACLYVVPDAIRLDISGLQSYYERHGITIAFLPTQIGEQFLGVENHSLRYLLLGGDKLHSFVKQRYAIVNNYGPTENTVVTTSWQVNEQSLHIPIGKPVSNTRIYILSELEELVATGVTGEICIGGAGLAKGYLNKPELTAEKFVADPFRIGERMYKTGDLGRWQSDGSIVFVGRKDDQVKIRGYRIELGEIESVLERHEKISSAIVLVKTDASGDKNLVAYVRSTEELKGSAIRSYLLEYLPAYMIPAYIVPIEVMPLTANGKVDKKALPDPEDFGISTETIYVAPRNETEERLVLIWQELLGQENIGVKDNFFDRGGHSLKATQLISRISKEFNIQIALKSAFLEPTIEVLAEKINNDLWLKNSLIEDEENYSEIKI